MSERETTAQLPATRREFLGGALAVSALALTGLPRGAAAQPPTPALGSGEELQPIEEIRSQGGRLRATITIRSGQHRLPADDNAGTVEQLVPLRYFVGKDDATGKEVWPPPNPDGRPRPPLPGPTLRASVGDQVEIRYFNHVAVDNFPASAIDRAEQGEGCDVVTEAQPAPAPTIQLYPHGADDHAPNCFHASSTANLHFHGTHVTPDGLGDNVLLQLRPNPQVNEASVQADFAAIFAAGPPKRWDALPQTWRDRQLALLEDHDDRAIWKGKRGTPDHPALPPEHRLLPPTKALIASGHWPQYQVGAYPFCFKLTEFTDKAGKPTGREMGQCPGTHWYHAHKHGSTAINVYNGMAGVFVIEGEYDDALARLYPNLRQHVLLVQNFSHTVNLKRTPFTRGAPSLRVNGQLAPTITMRPGEIQLWRMVNASVRAVTTLSGFGADVNAPAVKQIAQDGVQLNFENYDRQPLLRLDGTPAPRPNTFAPGNRIDLLVKAPLTAGSAPFEFKLLDTTQGSAAAPVTLLFVRVGGEPVAPAMEFPSTKESYPTFPDFLGDIKHEEIRISRRLDFGWEDGRFAPGLGGGGGKAAPKFTIDGRQFKGERYDQTMVLGDSEEWLLTNSTAQIAHPFHIHVNPFQVVEVRDPTLGPNGHTYRPAGHWIWQDVIAIPPAKFQGTTLVERGHVRIRHRFVDFPGSYVLHCHMLAHEDRGMMQLVRVIRRDVTVPHH